MRAKNLKYLRNKFGMNQTTFGKKLGIAQNTLSDYERGARPVPDEVAQSLAYQFRVSAHDFTCSDLSEYDVVFDAKNGYLPELSFVIQTINSFFPLIAPAPNSEDGYFIEGYKKILALLERLPIKHNINWEEMEACLQLFQASWNSNKDEGALANCICTFLLMCTGYYVPQNEQEKLFAHTILDQTKLNYLDAQKVLLRDMPNHDELSELTQQRLEFVREHEDTVMAYIKILKSSSNPDYRDLADYYFACTYIIGFVDNEFDFDTNKSFGEELFRQLLRIENRYVHRICASALAYIANSDI